jgi:oligopeptide transport system substrate-binding protein
MRNFGLFTVAALSLFVLGCGKTGGGGGGFSDRSTSKGGVFRYPLPTNPTTLDPGKVQDGDTIDVTQQIFEGLVKWGEDNKVQPNLAEKWDISPDGKTYTFHLKSGVKFSNGRALTAGDFKFCIERACSKTVASSTAQTYMGDIIGVNDLCTGKAKEASGVKVVDDATLEITIDKPRPYFLGKLTYQCAFVFAKEALKDPFAEMSKIEEMVGTGPFKISEYTPDGRVVLDANKDYHGGKPELERIERPIVKDGQTRLNLYKQGQVELISLERQDLDAINRDEKLKSESKKFDRPSMFYVGLNCNLVPALKDVRVRRAIAMAIDRDKIVTEILGGVNQRADSILPPSVLHYREKANVIPFNVAGAKTLLAEAGFADGKGFPELTMSYRDGRPDIEIVVQAVQQQLKQNLGINVKPNKKEWGAYLAAHNQKKTLECYHMRWGADYLDPENFLSTLLATYGNENKVNYSNSKFDALCKEADGILDEEKRAKLYAEAEDIVLQDAPFVPIYFQRDVELISPRVSGLRESAFGHLPHTTTSVK